MTKKTSRLACIILLCLSVTQGTRAANHDWPNWSGPVGDRSASGNGIFAAADFGLETSWVEALGSGYSGVSVAGSTAVTGLSDGTNDVLVAIDIETGNELWRYTIAPTYKGHDGSDDGPIATPTLHDGIVYGLGPRGQLFALHLSDGSEVWKRQIDTDFGARKPVYGYASSPAVVGEVLVVQTGGAEGHSITGLDRLTGDERWSTGDDAVSYQSPIAMPIGTTQQVLAVTNTHLYGLDPEAGTVQWQLRHSEQEEELTSQPVRVGQDRVLLNFWNDAALYRVAAQDGGGSAAEELWRSRSFRSSYALPVFWQGYLYGYSGSILVCVDTETGKPVWKSRGPGDGSLILVDGHLVIQNRDGDLIVAEATPEGYREKTRTRVLERGYLTSPSFAAGRLFTRNLTQIASLTVKAGASQEFEVAEEEIPVLGEFADWVAALETSEDKTSRIDALLAAQDRTPILEGDHLVHFVYRGDEPDLVLTGTFLPLGTELPLHRIADTDLFVRSVEVEPASLYTYSFQVFDEPRPDPLNPERVGPDAQPLSVLKSSGWQETTHLEEPAGPRGTVEELLWTSETLENERPVKVYLPAGYQRGNQRYPLLVVNLGDQALAVGQMDRALDNLIGDRMEPVVVAFVGRLAWEEYAGSNPDGYTKALVEELLPILERDYRLRTDAASRGIMGVGSGAFISMYATFTRPGTFGRVGTQSFYFGERKDDIFAALEQTKDSDVRAFVQWSVNDYFDERSGIDSEGQSRQIVDLMRTAGTEVTTLQVGDGPGWMEWSSRWNQLLPGLFPLP